jgi:hypothetical protein
MRKALFLVEWMLLIAIGGMALIMVLPVSGLFDRDTELSAAKKKGYYYEVNADKQTYFNKKVSVDGVVYGEGELVVYMTAKGLFTIPNLPQHIQVKTDSGEVFDHRGSSASSNIYQSSGQFTFKNVPPGIKSITVFKEAYGQSLSFHISLGGGKRNE